MKGLSESFNFYSSWNHQWLSDGFSNHLWFSDSFSNHLWFSDDFSNHLWFSGEIKVNWFTLSLIFAVNFADDSLKVNITL